MRPKFNFWLVAIQKKRIGERLDYFWNMCPKPLSWAKNKTKPFFLTGSWEDIDVKAWQLRTNFHEFHEKWTYLSLIDFLRQRIKSGLDPKFLNLDSTLHIFCMGGGYFKYVLYGGGGCLGDDLVIMSWQSD